MIKSMYSAVAGLKSHQTLLDVIGNNIANVNTVGFKASRVLFSDIYYDTVSNASEPSSTSGGTNPVQIGYGSKVASIDVLMTRTGYQESSRPMDLYISGEGYFAVQDSTGKEMYTRVGSLRFNADGTLIDSNGNFVLGYDEDYNYNYNHDPAKLTITNFDRYTSLYIDEKGMIMGTNSNTGKIEELGQVTIATFANPEALQQEGNMCYTQTKSSGSPEFSPADSATTGTLIAGGLEMSNVDLTKEFTDMIVAQRGFQANSRVITTSDSVLEELVNLKR